MLRMLRMLAYSIKLKQCICLHICKVEVDSNHISLVFKFKQNITTRIIVHNERSNFEVKWNYKHRNLQTQLFYGAN